MKSPIKIRPAVRRAAWGALTTVAALAAMEGSNAFAGLVQPFTQGNVVVERAGDGTATLTSAGTPIFLDQFTPGGTLVSSQEIATNGPSTFVDSGNSTTEGFVSLNPFGTNLVLAGYNVPAGTIAPNTNTAVNAPRAVATVDYNGNFNLAATSTAAFDKGNIRSAATDGGTNFYGSGSVVGVYLLGAGPAGYVSTTLANERVVEVVGGDTYFSTGSGSTRGVYKITGTPTTSGNVAVSLINSGAAAAPNGFSFSPDFSQAYVADTTVFTTSAAIGGIEKWTNNAGTWQMLYSLAPGTGNGASGLAVDWTTTPVTIYVTTANGNNLVKVQDTGVGAIATTNAIAGANTAFRSVSLAPTNATFVAQAPSITGVSPASLSVNIGGTATFTLFGSTGNPIGSNQWYKISGGATNGIPGQTGQALVLSNVQLTNTASYFAILTNASGSATSAVVTLNVTATPSITSIAPLNVATNAGSTVVFTLTASLGTPVANIFWYKISNSIPLVTNLITTATTTNLTLTSVTTNDQAKYFAILTNASGSATSAVVSLLITNFPPVITSITPLTVTTNAGSTVLFTVANTGTPPFTYNWYKETATTTNLIPTATNAVLTLSQVIASDIASYQVVISNASTFTATSAVVSLTVTNDPHIAFSPANTFGLLDGTVSFSVGVVGTTPGYQWYYSDGGGNILAPVVNGTTTLSGVSLISGASSSTLSIGNLQFADLPGLTNLVVVVTNLFGGAVTSSPASLLGINTSSSVLAFWDFNGPEFSTNNTIINPNNIRDPITYLGAGTASPVGAVDVPGTSPFAGSIDNNNGPGFENFPAYVYPQGFPDHAPGGSWGTSTYPVATNGNKTSGVQFNVSTVGAKNIRLSYESRVSATASDYERVQYTIDGINWIDYPTSSTFGGVGSTYLSYSNDLTGFPGVANNPNFAVRVVTEFESTATYGVGTTNAFVGTANTYGTSGTVTYDVVTFFGDAITNNNAAPLVAGLVDTNTLDYVPVTNNFTVNDDTTPPDQLTYSAVALDSSGIVNPTFVFTGTGASRSLIITPNTIPVSIAAAPILVTVTDTNGDSTASWFTLTLTSSNLPPTNTLAKLKSTNMLANASLVVPFLVGDDHTTNNLLTDFTVSSDNNTLIPNANIVIGNTGGSNRTLTITPAQNQLGVALINITLNDDDTLEPKSTVVSIPITVRPNTNVIAIDYFDYDNAGALDVVSAGFWTHLSGNFGQMKVNNNPNALNTVTVDASANTENLQTALLGAPYRTNSGAVLYASYTLNMTDPTKLPLNNGTYVTTFNDGTANTVNVEGCLVVSTNGAALGAYRVGIGNLVGATALTSVQFPMDLMPGSNYVIVTALSVTNGFSTVWVNPSSQLSPSVGDTTPAATSTNLYNMVNFELRESGQPNGGQVNIGSLKVGTSFDAVFPMLHVQIIGTNAVINWSDPTLGIQATPNLFLPFVDVSGATTPYTNATSGNSQMFFRFGR